MKYEVLAPTSKCISYEVGDIVDLEKVGGVLQDQYGFIFDERYVKPVVNEWIPYDGKGQPVADDAKVTVRYKDYNGFPPEVTALAEDIDWSFGTGIMVYKLVEGHKAETCVGTEKSLDSHYNYSYKGIKIDPYRILQVYGVTNPALQHAIKKLLRCGKSVKDAQQDVKEVIITLNRLLAMMEEDSQ